MRIAFSLFFSTCKMLPLFPDLHVLKLGSGSGGWSEVLRPKFMNGVFVMEHLTVFSLTYDCDDEMLKAGLPGRRTMKCHYYYCNTHSTQLPINVAYM